MALRQWSSEIYTAEFRELQASTFCCSRDGRLGLLAGTTSSMSVVFFHIRLPQTILDIQIFPPGRRSLGLLCMEQPNELVRRTARSSRWLFHFHFLLLTFVCANKFRWEVGAGQWNPSQQFGNHIALCCNDKASFNVLHVEKQSFKKKDLIISLL